MIKNPFVPKAAYDEVAAELDRVQEAFDRAKARIEEFELMAAVAGIGTDPNGYYAGTPGFRVRQLQTAEAELDRAKPVIDAARAWAAVERQSGVSRVGTALVNTNLSLDRRAARARMLAAVDAYDTAQKAPHRVCDGRA